MSIPYLFLLMNLMLLWPGILTVVHFAAYDWQVKQIAVDNAATVMGQSDRNLFNRIIKYNRIIKGLEVPHHQAHLCKNDPVPAVAAACASADLGLETTIRSMHTLMETSARASWISSGTRGRAEMLKLNTIASNWDRPMEVPVHSETCSKCGLETFIEIDHAPVTTFIRAQSPVPIGVAAEIGGQSLKIDSNWNYKLKTAEERL